MIIKKAEFVTSISQKEKYLEVSEGFTSPEISVVGRSNVGKSSFINMLASQSKLARTSSTPGRTRLINIFNFNEGEFILVDLPGYGYAEASKTEKARWGDMIEGYLEKSTKLAHVFALVDARHSPTVQDKQMVNYLYGLSLPFTVIATKCDKLSKAELGRNIQQIATALALGRDNIIAVSAETKYGKDAVLKKIGYILDNVEIYYDEPANNTGDDKTVNNDDKTSDNN